MGKYTQGECFDIASLFDISMSTSIPLSFGDKKKGENFWGSNQISFLDVLMFFGDIDNYCEFYI